MTKTKTNKELRRGDIVRRSIRGARGFFYPDLDGRAIMVRKDCVATPQVGWHQREEYIAYQVSSDVFADKDRYGDKPIMVVWVGNNG